MESLAIWLIYFMIGAILNRKNWNRKETLQRKPKYIFTKRVTEIWWPNYLIAIITSIAFAFIMLSLTLLFRGELG